MADFNLQRNGVNYQKKVYSVATCDYDSAVNPLVNNDTLTLMQLPGPCVVTAIRLIARGTALTSGNMPTIEIGTPADADFFVASVAPAVGVNEGYNFTLVDDNTHLPGTTVVRLTAGGTISATDALRMTFIVEFVEYNVSRGDLLPNG